MLLGEETVKNPQYIQLLQRVSFIDSGSTGSVAASSTVRVSSGGITIPIPMGQAIRIVMGRGSITDLSITGKLTLLGGGVHASIQNGNLTTVAWPFPVTNVILGSQGVDVYIGQDELWLWSDFAESGSIPPGLKLFVVADVTNSDAGAAHSVTFAANYLVEKYLLNATSGVSHLGFP